MGTFARRNDSSPANRRLNSRSRPGERCSPGRPPIPSRIRRATPLRPGDALDEAILFDDRRHQSRALERRDNELRDLVSWQVFEDQAYPYGEERSSVPIAEPRTAIGFNADGDEFHDMALLSQDRLLIYLGREDKPGIATP